MPTDTLDAGELATQYGFAYAFLKSNPELFDLFKQAIKGDNGQSWSAAHFVAKLQSTKWYRHTAAPARQWIALKAADPATASDRLKTRVAMMTTLAQQMGLKASAATLQNFALSSILSGWDDNQTRLHLSATYHYAASKTQTGQAADSLASIKQIAASYALPISDGNISHWTRKMLAGTATVEDFKAYALQKAKQLFPTISDALDRGDTVSDYMDPYKQIAGQLLEVDPESVDWLHGKYTKVLNQVDSKGNRKIMDLSDAKHLFMTDPAFGYDRTTGGRQQASDLASAMSKAFGKTG